MTREKNKTTCVSFWLTDKERERLDRMAERHGLNRSCLLRIIVKNVLDTEEGIDNGTATQ